MSNAENRKIRMVVEYDGSAYAGWQRQARESTVQQTLEEALQEHLREDIRVTASGRTDSGVHALGQVVSFSTHSILSARAMERGLSQYLPDDIAVRNCCDAEPDFDARRSARLRWYRFFLKHRSPRPAVARQYLTHIQGEIDINLMQSAATVLAGRHDFSAFRASTCTATRTELTLHPILITTLPNNVIQIDYRCRSFLQNMVRILTGTLVAAGKGRISLPDIQTMLQTGQRHRLAVTVKPQGLFLYRVYYEDDIPTEFREGILTQE